MSNWINKIIDLGEVLEGETHEAVFKSAKKLDVKKVIPSCGCTSAVWNKENKTITAKFKADRVPQHLRASGKMETSKSIRVNYSDGSSEMLKFKTIIKVK